VLVPVALVALCCLCFCVPFFFPAFAAHKPPQQQAPPPPQQLPQEHPPPAASAAAAAAAAAATSAPKSVAAAPAATKRPLQAADEERPAQRPRAAAVPLVAAAAIPAAATAATAAAPFVPLDAPAPLPPAVDDVDSAAVLRLQRTASALRMMQPDPADRPRMGEPGLFWGGVPGANDAERVIEREHSFRLMEGVILPQVARRVAARNDASLPVPPAAPAQERPRERELG